MRDWIAKLTPDSWLGRKLLMIAVLAAACTVAFCWGRKQNANAGAKNPPDTFGTSTASNNNGRYVAYLGQDIKISREELGEYLIARFGTERLEFLVNRRIVEMECQKNSIFVTDREVEQRFQQDLRSFGSKLPLTESDFVRHVLKKFGKSLYEWKEDVIRPKIMMEKLVHSQVKVDDKDVREGFEARYGPKVQCRMIVLEKGDMRAVQDTWREARKGPTQFLEMAKKQFIPALATDHGKVPAIHKHFGDKLIEDTAFGLKENEISEPLKLQDETYVILMCEKHLPADISERYERVKFEIAEQVRELKIAQRLPVAFAELRQRANPRLVLAGAISHIARVEQMPQGGLGAFNDQPSLPSVSVGAPSPTKLLAPEGTSPTLLPNTRPEPLNILPPLPKIEVPGEKK